MIFTSILLLPSTFALGATSIVFAPFFERFCIPKILKEKKRGTLFTVLCGWLLSLLPYLFSLGALIHSRHYRDLGKSSVFDIINIPDAFFRLGQYVVYNLIPGIILNHAVLSWLLFALMLAIAVMRRKDCPWKAIAFFMFFGLFNTLIIYS